MARKRWKHPLDTKTGRLVFTPVLRATGARLDLVVDYFRFPFSKAPGYHGSVQDLTSGKWYAVYGKECDIPGCNCDAWVEEVPDPRPRSEKPAHRSAAREEVVQQSLVDEVAGALSALLTIDGVEGVGQDVTVLSPAELPPHLLGFVELLRAGAIELDEEMLLITVAPARGRRRKKHPVLERVRQSLFLLCRYAKDKGVPAEDIAAVLDEARRSLGSRPRDSKKTKEE